MKVLILTHHGVHSENNSLYSIINACHNDQRIQEVVVASRSDEKNDDFFRHQKTNELYGVEINQEVDYQSFALLYQQKSTQYNLAEFDLILLRLPRPVSDEFLLHLKSIAKGIPIINDPEGIIETSNKQFLLHFSEWTPDMRLCHEADDIMAMYHRWPIVLKPLREYGGKGIVRILEDRVSDDGQEFPLDEWIARYANNPQPYLGMRYLKNVNQGDKRIIVCGGEVLGASLRLPAENSWLCNVAQGGSSVLSEPTDKELKIVESISPILIDKGILLYGLDTLVDDDGTRVISEVNTLSIGGIAPLEKMKNIDVSGQIISTFLSHIS